MSLIVPTRRLHDGSQMPMLGLGTHRLDGDYGELKRKILTALDLGYRLIDTARDYGNEEVVGAAIRESQVPTNELYVVSKVPGRMKNAEGRFITGPECVNESLNQSLEALGVEVFGSLVDSLAQ